MTVINHKSISGITSITAPAGSDNLFTVHTNDTTERFRIDASGHQNISGIITAANFKTGTSNLHNTGLNIQDLDVDGHTNLDNVSIAGVTTFSGALDINAGVNISGLGDFAASSFNNIRLAYSGDSEIDTSSGNLILDSAGGTVQVTDNLTVTGSIETTGEIKTLTLVESTSGNDLRLNAGSANRDIFLQVNDSTLMTVKGSTGKIGIDENTPTGKLHISHTNGAGIFVDDSSNSSNSPYIQVLGKRSDGNTHQSFTGQIFLSSLRTDQKVASGKQLGTVLFGGNHTDGTEANILYAASIAGVADDNFDSATDMPTALVFKTGTTGRAPAAANVSSGDERLRITSGGALNIGVGNESSAVENLIEMYVGGANGSHATIRGKYNRTNEFNRSEVRFGVEDNSAGKGFLAFATGTNSATERVRIDSSGKVMIGTSTPSSNGAAYMLTVADPTNSSGNCGITIRTGNTGGTINQGSIFYSNATSGTGEYAGYLQYNHPNNWFRIGVGSAERLRIDSSGSLLINSTSNNGASNAGQTPVLYANGYSNLGGLRIKGGDDGNTIYKDGGDLCLVTASAHSIILKTAGGEQIKANNDGRVITTTNQSVVGLLVKNSSHDSRLQIYAEAANKNSTIWFGDAADDDIGIIDYDHNDNSMSFTTNTNERFRIHSNGKVTMGNSHTASSTHKMKIYQTGGAGGIELLQDSSGSGQGQYVSGIKHDAYNITTEGRHNAMMVYSSYHAEKVFYYYFANGVSNQAVRIHFPDNSTWTNGYIRIHTTYSHGNASGLLEYRFTHNANTTSNYNKHIQEVGDIGNTNAHYSMSTGNNGWSFLSWADNGGTSNANTHALEIRRDGSNAGNGVKIHLDLWGDGARNICEKAYLTGGHTYS